MKNEMESQATYLFLVGLYVVCMLLITLAIIFVSDSSNGRLEASLQLIGDSSNGRLEASL